MLNASMIFNIFHVGYQKTRFLYARQFGESIKLLRIFQKMIYSKNFMKTLASKHSKHLLTELGIDLKESCCL